MSVLVEAISVVVRRDAIAARYQGGWPSFVSAVPNGTLCMDLQLARVGFMHPTDVNGFLATLSKRGLTAVNAKGSFVDVVVIDQRTGPTAHCDWVEVLEVPMETGSVLMARRKGSFDNTLVCPGGWSYQDSLSRNWEFHPGVEPNRNHELLRTENGLDVYRDRTTDASSS